MELELLKTDPQLETLVREQGDIDVVIVDTEFMRRDTFYPRAALVQLCFPGTPDKAWLLDPLSIGDFSPLQRLFRDESVVKVLHSASEDLEVFQQLLGCQPLPLFDTQRAAAFAGHGFGLGYRALVEAISGLELAKVETRSDWLARPLSDGQLNYAAADVIPLLPAYQQLREELEAKGRLAWVLEDGAAAVQALTEVGPAPYLRLKSAWKLPPRQLAVLRELCEWREQRARQRDKPRGWILSDKICLQLAQHCPATFTELRATPEMPQAVLRNQGEALLDLIEDALAQPESELPPVMAKPLDREQRQQLKQLKQAVQRVIVGKTKTIELAITALLARGHVLIEDVPGTGKTTLSKALAMALRCDFSRIQFTPDLVPADVLGVNIFDMNERRFEFRPGPVFTQVLLADEINRATPRTQSALLEAMQERQVSIDGVTMALPTPFFVIATLNPVELEGTFPLPEAQLDRFLLRLDLGYPTASEEAAMLVRFLADVDMSGAAPVAGPDDIAEAQAAVDGVAVDGAVRDYLLAIVAATRVDDRLRLGASPRAALALQRASQAQAAIAGRAYVMPDDVKALAVPALAHRLIVDSGARLRGVTAAGIIQEILDWVAVPIEG